jgi:hypothetical protein
MGRFAVSQYSLGTKDRVNWSSLVIFQMSVKAETPARVKLVISTALDE